MPGRVVPGMVIDAVEAAIGLPFAQGIGRENAISDASLATVESGALRHLFFAERATAKIPGIEPDSARPIASGGIVGGGTMGRGIAMAFANAGLPVHLLDVGHAAVHRAMRPIREEYGSRVASRPHDRRRSRAAHGADPRAPSITATLPMPTSSSKPCSRSWR